MTGALEQLVRRGVAAQQAVEKAGALAPAITIDPRDRAAVAAFLKEIDADLIHAEHGRRLGMRIAEPVVCPNCNARLESKQALRRHRPECPKTVKALPQTVVIGEELRAGAWVPICVIHAGDKAGKEWAAQDPSIRRSRRVQRLSWLHNAAVKAAK